MKERPYYFPKATADESIRAVLRGDKTQMRVPLPKWQVPTFDEESELWFAVAQIHPRYGFCVSAPTEEACAEELSDCGRSPFGKAGDLLWVRETWARFQTVDHIRRPDGRAFSEVSDGLAAYRADGFTTIGDLKDHIRLMGDCGIEEVIVDGDRWTPSIHMPRWASRITLKVKRVWVERVQDIDRAGAKAEGFHPSRHNGLEQFNGRSYGNAELAFRACIDSIYPNVWERNDWMWCCEFEKVTP